MRDITVQIVHGHPSVDREAEIYAQMLSEAGIETGSITPPQGRAPMRTTFHVAVDIGAGQVLGTLYARLGTLRDMFFAPLIEGDQRLPQPICEAAAMAVLPTASGRGVSELLYRSVYCFARREGAASLAVMVDPLTLELFREDYGVLFRAMGPVSSHLGLDLVAAGEELPVLEEGMRRLRPKFYEFLIEPFSDRERARFGL